MFSYKVELKSNLPNLAPRSRQAIALALSKLIYEVEAEAKQRAPVLTGALKNSIQVLPPVDPLTREVLVGVNYGVYQELGTVFHAAQPFLTPAVEVIRPTFEAVIGKSIEDSAK